MQIDIQSRDIDLDQDLQEQIVRQLRFGLTCYQPEVRSVDTVVNREQTAGHTTLWRVRVCVRFRSIEDLLVEDVEGELQDAVKRAIDRSVRAVRQRIRFPNVARRYG